MRVLAIFSAAFSLAVLAAVYGSLYRFLLPIGLGCLLLAVLAGCRYRRCGKNDRLVTALVAGGLALGSLWTWGYERICVAPVRELDGQTVVLRGWVKSWPEERERGWSVLVSAQTDGGVEVDTLLYLDEQGSSLRPGDRISTIVSCRFAGRTFSGEEVTYYTAKGVFLCGTAHGTLQTERPERMDWRVIPAYLAKGLEENILSAFPQGVGEAVMAIVTGNRGNLTQPFTSSLQRSGLSHTAAVSGMHMAFLAEFFAILLGKFRRSTSLVVMPAALVFMMMAGCTPSVVRATVMILMLYAAPFFGRERDDVTALALALMVLLLQNPMAVTHVGLQLSFGAVAGILLVADPVSDFLRRQLRLPNWEYRVNYGSKLIYRLGDYFVSTLSATLGASVLTVPLCAVYFSGVSLLSPLSNLLTLWAVGLIFCGGFLVGVLGAVSPVAAQLLAVPVSWTVEYMDRVVHGISNLPLASITLDSFSYKLWTILLSFAILFLLTKRGRRHVPQVAALCGVTLGAAVLFAGLEFYAGPMSVTLLDVGQGQSVLLRQGRHLTLVDCGGSSWDNAGDLAADHIQNVGRRSLELLILTHLHDDHANGVPQLMDRMRVEQLILPDRDLDSDLGKEILSLAREHGTEVVVLREDTLLELGEEYRLELVAPLKVPGENEQGLSVLASWQDRDVLITGDMSGETEQLLLRRTRLPDTEILVAGHHGSKYSTSRELLQVTDPELVFISVGEDNRYGHPAPETLARLGEREVHRTDREGSITVTFSRGGVDFT